MAEGNQKVSDPEKETVSHGESHQRGRDPTSRVPGSAASPPNSAPNPEALMANLAKMLAAVPTDPHKAPKPMEDYRFWKTQPVVPFDSKVESDGAIEHKTVSEVPTSPKRLPQGFEWVTVDVTEDTALEEIYELLYGNYVEDDDEQFRFRYSLPFLKWALRPPGFQLDWNIGVKATESGKLVAFISGIPATISVRGADVKITEINFLCVHKKLRSKRLAPVLIGEVTRRVNLKGIWQALYTAGTILPSPVSTARYYHRSLDWTKLFDVGFSYLPPDSTPAQQVARFSLPGTSDLPGFREMKREDLDDVHALLASYLSRFELVQVFDKNELGHWLFESGGVAHPYVVECDGKIVDFASFYGLESTVIGNSKYDTINVAYSFYYATSAPKGSPELTSRLAALFQALLIEAKRHKYDVFNALTVLDNPLFLEKLKFGAGDGLLHYYLFNYRTSKVNGGIDKEGTLAKPGGVAAIML